jgi:polar amino acid transport system ATP-binding protein
MSTSPALELIDIHKSFHENAVLRGVSLSVDAGEVVALIGPSGSGKSTLLRCINQLEQMDQGQIIVEGVPVGVEEVRGKVIRARAATAVRQRRGIGMVFQQFNLFPHMTALENVAEGPRYSQRRAKNEVDAECRALLARVGLGDACDRYPEQLSGGMQQRVAIARALALKPRILLFDEPTSALDPELVGEVLKVMRELAADDYTMIVVTHELSFAYDVADRLVMLDEGLIIEEGPARSVLDSPREERTAAFLSRFTARH